MKEKPFLYIVISFILGILAGKVFSFPYKFLPYLFYFAIPLAFFTRNKKFCKVILLFYIFLFSVLYTIAYPFLHTFSLRVLPKSCEIEGWVVSPPRRMGNSLSFLFQVERFKVKEWERIRKKVKVRIYFPISYSPEVGEKYILRGKLSSGYSGDKKNLFFIVKERKDFVYKGEKKNFYATLLRSSYYLKEKFKRLLEEKISPPYSDILKGLILGGREVPYQMRELFLKRGIMHLLAVSGLHVGIVVFLFYTFLKLFPINPRIPPLLSIFLTFLYLYIVGFPSSGMRAGIITGIYLMGKVIGRETNFLNVLSLACLLLLSINPNNLFSPGFQLTFLITFFIVYLYPYLEVKLPIKPLFLKQLISVTLLAQISAMPLVAYHFYYVSIFGFFWNFLFFPLLPLLLGGGLLIPFFTLFPGSTDKLISFPLTIMLKFTLQTLERIKISGFFYPVFIPVGVVITIYLFYLLLPRIGRRSCFIFLPLILSSLISPLPEVSLYPLGKGYISLFPEKGKNFLYIAVRKWRKGYEPYLLKYLSGKRIDYIFLSQANWENLLVGEIVRRGWKVKDIFLPPGSLLPYVKNSIKVKLIQEGYALPAWKCRGSSLWVYQEIPGGEVILSPTKIKMVRGKTV
ncbi:ComEC/Rec2 family competence protein, partial [Candidatus Calescamantes bacterium]|nr:ComEC/Rec2 family competence protein [Candidatus Calescamantes bacterium]